MLPLVAIDVFLKVAFASTALQVKKIPLILSTEVADNYSRIVFFPQITEAQVLKFCLGGLADNE